jgi:hypothetical protein
MPYCVEKVLPDGKVETLHPNLGDLEAKQLAANVIRGYAPGAVKVRLTPFRWDDENARYVPDVDGAIEMPAEVEAPVEFDVETAGKDALKARADELGLDLPAKIKLEDLRAAVKAKLAETAS